MKQLKSRSQDLRSLFEKNITIEYVAEPLKSVSSDTEISSILEIMQLQDFDVIGIQTENIITGYVERSQLLTATSGKCYEYQKVFHPQELVAISTPLMKLLPILETKSRLFVLDSNQVSGIITYGDLQKAPVRMLLFGLITLLEMNLLRLVRLYYPHDSWQQILKSDRLEAAQKLWLDSRERNEATDLLDYLQFCDKRELILNQPQLFSQLGFTSKRFAEKFLKSAEHLRNRLAHAQNLVTGSSWQELIILAEQIEKLLIHCEEIE